MTLSLIHIEVCIRDSNIAILGDLQGPKLRVGDLEDGKVFLKEGDEIIFTTQKMVGTKDKVYVSYPNLTTDVQVGERIFLDDGKMELKVLQILNDKMCIRDSFISLSVATSPAFAHNGIVSIF